MSSSISYDSVLPRVCSGVSTSRPASPLVVISQPAVVSSHLPVHVVRVLPRTTDAVSQAVKPVPTAAVTVTGLITSQPSWTSVSAAAVASHFRPISSTVSGFQTAFNRATFPSTTPPSVHQLLSQSAVLSPKSRLPFSSSTPNLLAAGSKHVLVDSAGQVITTVVPPAGNGRRLDDGRLGKNSSFASGLSSASQVKFIICVVCVYGTWKQKSIRAFFCIFIIHTDWLRSNPVWWIAF